MHHISSSGDGSICGERDVDAKCGGLRLVGSLKLQVSFAEYSLFCTAILQKRPIRECGEERV